MSREKLLTDFLYEIRKEISLNVVYIDGRPYDNLLNLLRRIDMVLKTKQCQEIEDQWNDLQSWKDRCNGAEENLQNFLNAAPAQMSTQLGLLPINSEGMRKLSDRCNRIYYALSYYAGGFGVSAEAALEHLREKNGI